MSFVRISMADRTQVGFGFKKPIFIPNSLSHIQEFKMETGVQPSAPLELKGDGAQ